MNHFSNRSSLPDKKIQESRDLVLGISDIVWSIDENVEVLNQDSGLRGCWFRCKILDSSKTRLKVQYCDLVHLTEPKKLEEEITSNRVANPDKLGTRFTGRLMVRPWPCQEFPDLKFKVGDAVDAWYCDGWWEGIVLGYSSPDESSNLHVCLPGEDKFLTFERKDLRVSRDWIENKWMDIKGVSNILSLLSLKVDRKPMLLPPPVLVEPNSSAVATKKVCNSPRLEESENAKQDVPSSSKFAGSKAVDGPNQKKGLLVPPPVLVEANSSAVATNKVCNSPRLEESENAKRDVPSSSKSAGSKAVGRPNKRKGRLIKEGGIEKRPVILCLTKFKKSKPAIKKSK